MDGDGSTVPGQPLDVDRKCLELRIHTDSCALTNGLDGWSRAWKKQDKNCGPDIWERIIYTDLRGQCINCRCLCLTCARKHPLQKRYWKKKKEGTNGQNDLTKIYQPQDWWPSFLSHLTDCAVEYTGGGGQVCPNICQCGLPLTKANPAFECLTWKQKKKKKRKRNWASNNLYSCRDLQDTG